MMKPLKKYPWYIRIIFWAQTRKYGQVLSPSYFWGRVPHLFLPLQVLYQMIDRKHSPLTPQLRSLVSFYISQLNHCEFCKDIGAYLFLKSDPKKDKLVKLFNYRTDDTFSRLEKAVLSYAEAITKNETFRDDFGLDEMFTENQRVELTAVVCYFNMTSKFNAALNVPSQDFSS